MEPEAAPPKPDVTPNARRRALLLAAVCTASIIAVVAGIYRPDRLLADRYFRAEVSFAVQEEGTYAVDGAVITLAGRSFSTDAAGRARVEKVRAGSYEVRVEKPGYAASVQQVQLHRGLNGTVPLGLTRVPAQLFAVAGYFADLIGGRPLAGVAVTLDGKAQTADAAGRFRFDGLTAGSYRLAASLGGYRPAEEVIEVRDASSAQLKKELEPEGTLLFTSNRDGKRAVYTTGFSGRDQRRFSDPGTGEEYAPQASPDGKRVAYYSTREGGVDTYGNPLRKLYLSARDGSDAKRATADVAVQAFSWSPGGGYLFERGSAEPQLRTQVSRIIDARTLKATDLPDSVNDVVFSQDGKLAAYASSRYAEGAGTVTLTVLTLATAERRDLLTGSEPLYGLQFSAGAVLTDSSGAAGKRSLRAPLDGSPATEIPLRLQVERVPVLSPDGSLAAYAETRDGKRDIYVSRADGTAEKRLTAIGVISDSFRPVWGPAGSHLFFGVRREGETAVYASAVAGGDPRKVADYAASPDGEPYGQ